MESTLNIAISEPIREKYVQIFSLQQNISEMSVKTIWEKLMRKDFFTKRRDRGKEGRKVKRKLENSGGREKGCCEQMGERGVKEGMVRARERGWGLGLSCQKC